MVLIRNEYCPYISLVESYFDTIIWLKFDKKLCNHCKDIYIAFTYFPPYNSTFLKEHEVDLFTELEKQLSKYMSIGDIFIFGDLNSRTKTLPDFIVDDELHASVLDNGLEYKADNQLTERINPDQGHNEYGLKLLSLCKSTGVRIVNGRHGEGHSNDFTFNGARGLSTIDYLITTPDMFNFISKFIVCNFTPFSDHAPLHFEFDCSLSTCADLSNDCFVKPRNIYRWDPIFLDQCKNIFSDNEGILDFNNVSSQSQMDEGIKTLTDLLNNDIGKYFRVKPSIGNDTKKAPANSKTEHSLYLSVDDKPWFDENLKLLYNDYIIALKKFNHFKNCHSHSELNIKKTVFIRNTKPDQKGYIRNLKVIGWN